MDEHVRYERIGRVALLTINRPERLNALTAATARRMWALLDEVAADDAVRAVVLTGAGRGFCAGADLKDLGGYDGERDRDWGSPRGAMDFAVRMRALPQPSICAVNGVAAGAGFAMALATDLRVASEHASFIASQIRTARTPDAGLTWFLPRMVGYERALDICLTGRTVDAEEAFRLGLVSEVVPAEQLLERTMERAEALAAGPGLATRLARRLVQDSAERTLDEQLDAEYAALAEAGAHPDVDEGTRAFVEKRPPSFG